MSEKTHDYFSYNNGVGIIPEEHFRISASQVSKFFDTTTQWYREHLLGEKGFQGSTATELGTCVHAGAEMYAKEGVVHYEQIEAYIDTIAVEVDKDFIRQQYPIMVDVLITNYLESNMPTETELFIAEEILPGIWAGGSIDSIHGTRIVDYKTTSSKSPPTKIARAYWFQQCMYVWLARRKGYDIDSFRLVFITTSEIGRVSEKTGKPLKDYPSSVSTLDHVVTDLDMEIIENTVHLIAKSVDTWNNHPELRYLLAQDLRLRLPQKRISKFFNKKGAK